MLLICEAEICGYLKDKKYIFFLINKTSLLQENNQCYSSPVRNLFDHYMKKYQDKEDRKYSVELKFQLIDHYH